MKTTRRFERVWGVSVTAISRSSLSEPARGAPRLVGGFVGLLLTLAAVSARADNLAVLVFPVIIWPVGLLCIMTLLVMGIMGLVSLRRGQKRGKLASSLLVMSGIVTVGYPLFAFWADDAYRVKAPWEVWLITLLTVELVSLSCMAVGFVMLLKHRRTVDE